MDKSATPESNSLISRWRRKFACALRGVAVGIRDQNSFCVHFSAVLLVVVAATWLQVSQAEWLALILCITIVFAAELFNSAIEHLARAITSDDNAEIRDALDVASGAVLLTALGAAVVGLLILGRPLLEWLMTE